MSSGAEAAGRPIISIPSLPAAGPLAFVRRHPIATYVVVTYLASWSYWIWMAANGWMSRPGGTESHFPGLAGPAIGAFVVTALVGGRAGLGELLARTFRWRVSPRWYLVAALPFGFFLVGAAIQAAVGDAPRIEDLARFSGLPELSWPLVLVLVLIVNCFGEEIGWRGFATPRLLACHGLLLTSLLVMVMWATWHLAAVPVVETYSLMGWGVIPMLVFGLGSGAVVFTWLYARTQSVLITALFHLALNMGSATLAARGLAGGAATVGIMLWAVAIIAIELRRPGESKTSNRPLVSILRGPLGGRLGRSIALLSYTGRSSGRMLSTPVEYVRDGTTVSVYVGAAERKQWWRNVRAHPTVRIRLAGRDHSGRATVFDHDEGTAAQSNLATYVAGRPRVASRLGLAASPPFDPAALRSAAGAAVTVRIDLVH